MDDRTHLPIQAAYHAEPGLEGRVRHDWTRAEVEALFALPFPDLIFHAQRIHRTHFDPRAVQISTLLSIKTGGCPEDCAYCPQSAQYDTGVNAEKLMDLGTVVAQARAAKAAGATQFCMGAAWRSPKERDLDRVCAMVAAVRDLGLETCATLGMLTAGQAARLSEAGLDYYNHNLDTSPEFYGEIISTRTYQDHLETLDHVRTAGIAVCCGGIVGMGEGRGDRAGMIAALASLPVHPESGADQPAGSRRRHAARRKSRAGGVRPNRIRAHRGGRPNHDAGLGGAAVGWTRGDERNSGPVFPRRRQFDLFRPKTAHHAEPGGRARCGADGQARTRADAVSAVMAGAVRPRRRATEDV